MDVGTQQAQGIHEDTDRTVLHALRSRQHMGAARHTQVSRHKAHGCPRGLDVDLFRHLVECLDNHFRIVAVTEVLRQVRASAECVDDQCPVGYALRSRQLDGSVKPLWC